MAHWFLYLALSFATGAIAMLSALLGLTMVAGKAAVRLSDRRQGHRPPPPPPYSLNQRGIPAGCPFARVDGLEPRYETPTAVRQAIFLRETEPRAAQSQKAAVV